MESGFGQVPGERRRRERRRRPGFRWHERRTGFDRRRPPGARMPAYHSFLLRLSGDRYLLLLLLVAINLLSLTDFGLTLFALDREMAQEANPVLRLLFSVSPYAAVAFKTTLVLLISVLVWEGRRYRRLLETGLLVMALFVAVIVYQIGGLLRLA